ncbi:MAG: hypothetical protein GF364_09235 [Candidatus Lokiarchaeota archaeon]|nr:hypothetical protein [Candidatus Lokiarchaeota archaeon]
MNIASCSTQTDAQDDIRGLKLEEDYEILENTDSFGFIDIVNIIWMNDSVSYNISIEFKNDVNTTKILNNDVFGWISFYNITPSQYVVANNTLKILISKSSEGAFLNETAIIYDGDNYNKTYNDCALISGKYINWSLPAELFENITLDPSFAKFTDWVPEAFFVYTFESSGITYIYWDSVSYDSLWDEIWNQIDSLRTFIPGYNPLHIIIYSSITVFIFYYLVGKKQIKNSSFNKQ